MAAIDLSTAVARLIGRPLGGDALAVAVSGGPDSVALLLLAHAAFVGQVSALTVDHGLRPGSAAEAATVAALCAQHGVPHRTLSWLGPKPAANVQATAREARYALLGDWCAAHGVPWLLTAHHADDQAETLLMRLARGSGNAGLAGIRASRPLVSGVTLLRPLLGLRRDELGRYLATRGESAVHDPANADPRYDRTAARALLAATPWLGSDRLATAAAHLAEAETALAWVADLAWDSRVQIGTRTIAVDAVGLPRELRRRLVARAVQTLGKPPSGPEIDRLLARLDAGATATLGGVQARGGNPWTFRCVIARASRDCTRP